MLTRTKFPKGLVNGNVSQLGTGSVFTTGNVWYVNSATGSNDNVGNDPSFPKSTLAGAVAAAVASNGDVVVLMPGHNEVLTSSVAVNKAGLTVLGIGSGDDMPQFNFNHANAEISVAADDITIENVRFSADVTAVAIGIEIEDGVDNTTVRGCLFDVVATGTDEFNAAIHMVNDNSYTLIEGNTIHMGLGGAVAAIHMDADTAYTVIRNNYITGDYSTACILGDTTLSTNILIDNNLLVQGIGGNIGTEPGIELLTGTTGVIQNNNIVCNLATKAASIVADTCFLFENYYNEDAAGTGGLIGAVSADD